MSISCRIYMSLRQLFPIFETGLVGSVLYQYERNVHTE